jgi:signal transduction histidine kinase
VADARAAGLGVEVAEEGARPQLAPGLDLVVYRVVQEALTNARRHGDGGASLRLRYGPRALEIDVRNGGVVESQNGDGHGLIGMRERVALFGGTLEAVKQNGGFRVHAVLPVEEAPA